MTEITHDHVNRARFLEALPVAPAFDPCRCGKCPGYSLDVERNMWVCGSCRKPCGANRHQSPFCYECGEPFTYKVMPPKPEKYPFCPTCADEE